jgi:hypothetical protein
MGAIDALHVARDQEERILPRSAPVQFGLRQTNSNRGSAIRNGSKSLNMNDVKISNRRKTRVIQEMMQLQQARTAYEN